MATWGEKYKIQHELKRVTLKHLMNGNPLSHLQLNPWLKPFQECNFQLEMPSSCFYLSISLNTAVLALLQNFPG